MSLNVLSPICAQRRWRSTALASARTRSLTALRTRSPRRALVTFSPVCWLLSRRPQASHSSVRPLYVRARNRAGCAPLLSRAFDVLQKLSATPDGRARFSAAFKLCSPLNSQADAEAVVNWVDSGLIGMAMLDYPFATNYGISLPGTISLRLALLAATLRVGAAVCSRHPIAVHFRLAREQDLRPTFGEGYQQQ